MSVSAPGDWIELKRQEQVPQAFARLAVIGLFMGMCGVMWAAGAPMPLPFFLVLCIEAWFFVFYWRAVFVLPTARSITIAHYGMLAAEIVFHTTMVYYLGGIYWLGGFAYVFGLIFANAYLDAKRGFAYTLGVVAAFTSLALLDAASIVPHYAYLGRGAEDASGRFLFTTVVGGAGVFFSIYVWVNWVGRQMRRERDTALRSQLELIGAHAALTEANTALEQRVQDRTAALRDANIALLSRDAILSATVESTADGILVIDRDGKAAHANGRFSEMWRIPAEIMETRDDDKLIACVLDQLVEPEAFLSKVRELYQSDRQDLDTLLFKDGRVFERYSRPLVTEGAVNGRVWSFRDITNQRRNEDILRKQASRDPLTDCLNHAAVAARTAELALACVSVAIVMADVDGMKAINDTYGHQVGDAALLSVARALARPDAIVGRYGGDEFVAVLPERTRAEAEQYCHEVMRELGSAVVIDQVTGSRVPVVASMGIAVFPMEAQSIDEAIRLADHAMYTEKRERKMAVDSMHVTGVIADDRAAKMIGEIVPLLTAPGELDSRLQRVAHQLSVGAGYDIVRFSIAAPDKAAARAPMFARVDPALMSEWETTRAQRDGGPVRDIILRTRRPVIIHDLQEDERWPQAERDQFREAGIHGAAMVPMLWQDEVLGLLSVATKRAGAIDARDVQFLMTVADQVTAIIRMETLVVDLQAATGRIEDARVDTVVMLAAAAEAHEQNTGAHLLRVEALSRRLAIELGYDEPSADEIGHAAILHDIGKIRVPESILLSPARLDGSEWTIMKQHTTWGAEFLAQRSGFELAAVVAACHHERWDGAGYPRGLSGAQIPEVACIVTVADSFDAITSDRPYRNSRPVSWAVEEIVRCTGSQFSPRVVEALERMYDRGELLDAISEDKQAA